MDTTPAHIDTSYLHAHGLELGAGAMAYIKGVAKKHRRSRIVWAHVMAVPADESCLALATKDHLGGHLGKLWIKMMCDGTTFYAFSVALGGWRSTKPN